MMPKEFTHIWESLSEDKRDVVARQASFRGIKTPSDAFSFWKGRDFTELGHEEFVTESLSFEGDITPELTLAEQIRAKALASMKQNQGNL